LLFVRTSRCPGRVSPLLNVRFLVRPTARPTAELGRQEPLAKSAPRRQTGRRCLASSANAGCRITDKRQIRTFAPRSPDHSSSRIASGCSMRGTNGDHRQPIRRQRSGAWSDRQPLQHPWRQIGQLQEWADEGLGDARGDRSAPDRCDIPAIHHRRQSQTRAMTRSRCGSGGVPSAALSISAGCRWGVRMSQRCSGALAAMDGAMDTRRYTMRRPSTVPFEETSMPR
jgi:hypothetical protein